MSRLVAHAFCFMWCRSSSRLAMLSLPRSLFSSLIRPLVQPVKARQQCRPLFSSRRLLYKENFEDPMEDEEFRKEFNERVFQELAVEDFADLIQSPADRQMVEEILKDYEFLKYTTDRSPSTIPKKCMAELMQLKSPSAKMNYFNYMFKTEMKKLASKRQRHKLGDKHREMISAQKDYPVGQLFDEETNEPIYRKWHNSVTMRIRDSKIDSAHDYKKQLAAMFGQPLVVDWSYEQYMTKREIVNTCKQLAIAYGHNYRQPELFDLWFCNYDRNSLSHKCMIPMMPNLEFPNTLVSLEPRSYLDIFPRERLVYLTPHASATLRDFSDDDIYVMGALVDRTIKAPVSLAKAKKEGIRMARLPIDEHVVWGAYSKVLTLNQIVAILLQVKNNGGDWKDAFNLHIPSRKLKSPEDIAQEEVARLEKMTFKRKKFFKLH